MLDHDHGKYTTTQNNLAIKVSWANIKKGLKKGLTNNYSILDSGKYLVKIDHKII